ncbi:hypothetical protein DL95DRAFT_412181 [Leptodontidium sp. 2 PMI_412]|nr:hypothetical protein DL95DRAFT_412181 [Leptodontidium sp. 2 PMI_412]
MDPPSNLASSDNHSASLVLLTTAALSALASSTSQTSAVALSATPTVSISRGSNGQVTIMVGGETFTDFPTLPAELRTKIWKHTFEVREAIALGHKCYMSAACDDADKAWKRENNTPLPDALFISQESRTEVLKYYSIIHRSDVNAPVKFGGIRPICASPTDLFWIEFVTLMHSPGELHDWLSALKTSYPGFLNKVTKLEVRGTFSQAFFVNIFAVNRKASLLTQDFRKMYCASFLLFPALKEITFTGKRGDEDWNDTAGMMFLRALESWIVGFLNGAKVVFETREAPKVTFRSFKTFEESLSE